MAVPKIGTHRLTGSVLKVGKGDNLPLSTLKMPEGAERSYLPWMPLRCEVDITAAAAAAGTTLTDALKDALLKGACKTTVYYGDRVEERERVYAYRGVSLWDIQMDAWNALERTVQGYADTEDGLGRTLVGGVNTVRFVLQVPLGYQETFLGAPSMGIGADQISLLVLQFDRSAGGDPLNALNPNLTLGELRVDAWADPRPLGAGRLWMDTPTMGTLSFGKQESTAKHSLGEGLFRLVTEESSPTSSSALGGMNLELVTRSGKRTLSVAPAKPRDILDTYLGHVDVGATERRVAEVETLLHAYPDTDLKDVFPGTLLVHQNEEGRTEGIFRHSRYNMPSEAWVRKVLALLAKPLAVGTSLKLVHNAQVEAKKLRPDLVPFFGYRIFGEKEDGFAAYTGLVVTKAKAEGDVTIRVDIPTMRLTGAAARYRAAADLDDDRAKKDAVEEEALYVPACIIDADGFKGGVSGWFRDVSDAIRAAAKR